LSPGTLLSCASAVAVRPGLWATAAKQYRESLPSRWWARRPFLPLPAADYMRFRLQTQYGALDHRIEPADVLNYLSWCRLQRSLAS
jgi:hypothetical protein